MRFSPAIWTPFFLMCASRSLKIGRAQSELQSRPHLVCRLLLEKKKNVEVYREQGMILSPLKEDAIQLYSATRMFISAISIRPLGLIEGDLLIARRESKLLSSRARPNLVDN